MDKFPLKALQSLYTRHGRFLSNLLRGVPLLYREILILDYSRFEYFARELDPAVDLGVPFRRHLTNTRSDASFEVARSWVADCCANRGSHGEPDMAEPQGQSVGNIAYQHPTRLIDLQATSDGLERLALIDTRTINPGSYTYCTLSYCWGKQINPSWITTKANLQDRRAGFDRAELPATLSDAIFIAQRLGLRYIWIDAICIVQDDDDDWALEGLKMAGIYKGSHLTIAAALGYSSTDGAFNKQSTYHLEGCKDIVRIDSSLSDGRRSTLYFYAYSLSPRPYQHVEDNSLTTRAWCLQEILLSSRILYYTKAQLLWQCNHIRLQEDGVVEPRHFDNPETLNDILYGADLEIPRDGAPALTIYERINLWCFALVPQYTERKLARGGDKLVAISAIARVISLNTGAEYLAGLWRDMLLISLLWYRISSGKKTSSYRCPSWSWASQDSAVKYHLPWRQDIFLSRESPYEVNFDAYITAAEVKADHRNPFGAVTGGLLKLCGRLMCRGTVMLEPGRQHPQHILIIWDHLRPLTTGVLWMDDDDAITEQVLCVYLGHDRALILEHATESHDLYRRIGLFFWATPSTGKDDATVMLMERVKSAPRQIFTII
ncbi:hypothetical protein RRF57_004804 [Xylaria bambusicola]|uniref:Heterokaryon incompatibility domain-containing protein n=1 Tax=Xylaria bambusicola TaxID=326684 RepID=A0AAN7UWY3_9PEZI